MKIGVMVILDSVEIDKKFKKVIELGFNYCQLCCWDHTFLTDEVAKAVLEACKKYSIEISTFWCGWSGPAEWNFYEGPLTLGLVPKEFRNKRIEELICGSDFARKLGLKNMATHMGFLPEVPLSNEYKETVSAIRQVAQHCKKNNQYLLFETGQETPVTLRRTIEDVGEDNLGINLDAANLILYGKANPVDALDVFGEYVRDVHAKDGKYPTDGRHLGEETPLGEGKVDISALIKKLKEVGYNGTLIIEREISGEKQKQDIISAKKLLEKLI